MPLYQGGAEYAAIRQARQQQQQTPQADRRRPPHRRAAGRSRAWETYDAAKSAIESTRAQIRANEIALEGVQREAIVGSRTTLDVLNAEQALLNSRVTLVQNLANLVTASYGVAAAVGPADRARPEPAGAALRRDRLLQCGARPLDRHRRLRHRPARPVTTRATGQRTVADA